MQSDPSSATGGGYSHGTWHEDNPAPDEMGSTGTEHDLEKKK